MKKIVYIINVDWYFHLHWLDRALAIKEEGLEVHIITQFTKPKIKTELDELGFICHPIELQRTGINPYSEWKSYQHISQHLKNIQPDIIHSITLKPNIYVGLQQKSKKTPLFLSITGLGIAFSSSKFLLIKKNYHSYL